jgi:hypothetical protein
MATLFVSEHAALHDGAPLEPALASQTVSIGGTSAASSAFNASTRFVRVRTDAICSVKFGADPTATASDARLPAGASEVFAVKSPIDAGSRLKVAVISNT